MKTKTKNELLKLSYAGACLALCMVLPTITGGIPTFGKYLCPMHLPVLLCGLLCGPIWGFVVGVTAPLLRFALFGAPIFIPHGVCMMSELAIYGLISGLLYRFFMKKRPEDVEKTKNNLGFLYLSLLVAMICGRLSGGVCKIVLLTSGKIPTYAFSTFLTSYFVETLPGVVLQLVLIPIILVAMKRAKLFPG